uniref:Si:dkey-93h22.7 n=1 Tax=Neogobius melanostomus TaxID=47308 RepID=A0A8C6TBU0_9GOBI
SAFSLFPSGLSSCYEDNNPVLGRPQLFGPSEALVKKALDFYCELSVYPKNETILLQLFREGDRSKLLGVSTSLDGARGVFPILFKTFHDGNLECVASAQNNTSVEPSVSSVHRLRVIEVRVSSEKTEFFEGSTLELRCDLGEGTYATYKWFLDGKQISETRYRYFNESFLQVFRTSSKDSGSYMCMAQNSYNKTIFHSNSSVVNITVKDVVSTPSISFNVLKEDWNYSALLSCHSQRGTPPVTFTLYNRDELIGNTTEEDRSTTFTVPIELGKHMGWLQCRADNGDQTAYSHWMPLLVEPVQGPVTLHYDYDTGQNYAVVGVRFYCNASKGSHVKFEWFLNKTLLPDVPGSFYRVVDEAPARSILLFTVGRSSAGTYHCEASDEFDNTTAISSRRKYLDKEVLNRLPDVVVAVVFGCFSLMIIMVCVCCGISIVYSKISCFTSEMKKMTAAYEEDLASYLLSEVGSTQLHLLKYMYLSNFLK